MLSSNVFFCLSEHVGETPKSTGSPSILSLYGQLFYLFAKIATLQNLANFLCFWSWIPTSKTNQAGVINQRGGNDWSGPESSEVGMMWISMGDSKMLGTNGRTNGGFLK